MNIPSSKSMLRNSMVLCSNSKFDIRVLLMLVSSFYIVVIAEQVYTCRDGTAWSLLTKCVNAYPCKVSLVSPWIENMAKEWRLSALKHDVPTDLHWRLQFYWFDILEPWEVLPRCNPVSSETMIRHDEHAATRLMELISSVIIVKNIVLGNLALTRDWKFQARHVA